MFLFSTLSLFVSPVSASSWSSDGYSYYKQITINHDFIDSDLVNFPVLISSNNITMLAKMDGGDSLRFTNLANDTEYNFEIEKFDDVSDMVVWVNITFISSTVDTVFNMYYGNGFVSDGQNIVGTWNSGYKQVLHFSESSGTIYDSTSNNYDSIVEDFTYNVTGLNDGAINFDDTSNDYMNTTGGDYGDNDFTIYFMMKSDNALSNDEYIFSNKNDYSGNFVKIQMLASGELRFLTEDNDGGSHMYWDTGFFIDDGSWNFVGVQHTDSLCKVWNGSTKVEKSSDLDDGDLFSGDTWYLGYRGTDVYQFDGSLDEFRFYDGVLNDSWMKADFHSVNSTTDFLNFGVECDSLVVESFISDFYPVNNSIDVNPCSVCLCAYVSSNLSFDVSFESNFSGSWVALNNSVFLNVTNNTFCYCCNDFQKYNTSYYWRVVTGTNTSNVYKLTTLKECTGGDDIIVIDTNQFVIGIQIVLFILFIWIGYSIPAMEGDKKTFHYMPFSGGMFIIFSAIDFISLSISLNTYELGMITGYLTTVGIILLLVGILKAFYYQ